jgi:hypothetical protein
VSDGSNLSSKHLKIKTGADLNTVLADVTKSQCFFMTAAWERKTRLRNKT